MQPSTLDLISILLPNAQQSLSLLALMLIALGFTAIGGAIGGRNRLPEADLIVGWAVVAAFFTVFGRLTPVPFTVLSGLAGLGALASGAVLWRRGEPILDRAGLWMLAALLPFFVITASMQPSQWDEFSQWLPNARYLVLFDAFPGAGMPPSDSVFPSYPHAIPLLPYLASILSHGYAEGVMPWFNLLLLACAGRLAIRQFRGDGKISLASAAWGSLAVTAIAPTFVPKSVLSTYADTATAVALAFSGILGLRMVERGDEAGWGAQDPISRWRCWCWPSAGRAMGKCPSLRPHLRRLQCLLTDRLSRHSVRV